MMCAAPALLIAFIVEPPILALDRPISFYAILGTFVALMAILSTRWPRNFTRRSQAARALPTGLIFRPARVEELPRLQDIRARAFAPIFAAFRRMLGDEVYEFAQAHEDAAQAEILPGIFDTGSPWRLDVAELAGEVVGFIALRIDSLQLLGEIGLNAVEPRHAGRGIGTAMYRHALSEMRGAGVRVATVATGGDEGHVAARTAYRKVGFDRVTPGLWMCCALTAERESG